MARRSSSNRWSRPATGKQIAALKGSGKYDGKYYSMGRASQAIGGSSGASTWSASRWSSGGRSSGSAYSPLATSATGPQGLPPGLLFGNADLDSLLTNALGGGPQSRLASSDAGPERILSELLGVPDDLDSLVQLALGGDHPDQASSTPGAEAVESVSYTVRSDDSDPAQPTIVIEAEVVRNSTFEGKPSVQIRFIDVGEPIDDQNPDRTLRSPVRSGLAYRPTWTPVLVRTPAELAEQMRVHWVAAVEELDSGVDPRLTTFLAGAAGMEGALAVLNSGQSTASKYIHLQGILDPFGPIQFQGLGLDAATFAEQIRKADDGDPDALDWLTSVQHGQVLTSYAEVSGTGLAAEADFRLERWRKQANDFIDAVTMNADDFGFDFSTVREILALEAKTQAQVEEMRARSRANPDGDAWIAKFLRDIDARGARSSIAEYGLPEDWFFEESRIYLQTKLHQSLPAQFAAALTPRSAGRRPHDALAEDVRGLASTSSVDPDDYAQVAAPKTATWSGLFADPYGRASRSARGAHRLERITQAVRRANAELEAAGEDDLGTLVVVREVLAYAKWRRDELLGAQQIEELGRRREAADQRSEEARERARRAKLRLKEARKYGDVISSLDRIIQSHVDALAHTKTSIDIVDPLPMNVQIAANDWVAEAKERGVTAGERLAAAEERERWAASEVATAGTPSAREQLTAERDAAVAEQAEARAERDGAQRDSQSAKDHQASIAEARAKFEERMRPVRVDNEKRLHVEAEARRAIAAKQEAERRQQAEQQRKRWAAEQERRDAANRLQEETNQRQQERARAAKSALSSELKQFLALPATTSFWRRKTLEASRASLEQRILDLQSEIVAPLEPPRTNSRAWPSLLSRGERYLGTVRKFADYGVFVSLPAGADGLLRGSNLAASLSQGQRLVVEIADMPYGKPIVLKRAAS